MAKDPAFLFYPGDWLGGTITFTRAHKGAYMDLLMAQFNQGHLGIEDVKHILGSDFESMWESKLKGKFKSDEDGKFYNEKLETEFLKRKNFTKSRRENLNKDIPHMQPHTVKRMENENEDVNIIDIVVEDWKKEKQFWIAWNNWIAFRMEIKKPLKGPISKVGQIKKLIKLSDAQWETAIAIIEQSIGNNWQGFFPLRDNGKNGTNGFKRG